MHVLHVIDGLGLGGAERMLVDLANRTVADGHRASVCITRSNTTLASALDQRIEVLVLRRTRRFTPALLLHFARWVRKRNVDVMHVHLRSNLSFVLPLRALQLVRTPIVFHDHYGTIEIDTEIPRWFKHATRYIDHYVGVYDMLEQWARRSGLPASRTSTISNALDLDRLVCPIASDLRSELEIEADVPLGIMVATLRPDKGIEVLLDAIARSRHRGRFRIAIAGHEGDPAYAAACRQRCRDLELEHTVTFLGPRTDVPGILASADFALLSSHTESGPLVLIEYLAARLPLVSTKVGDIGRRLAAFGVAGFVPARDIDRFVSELDALLELSADERCARGERGYQVLTESWDIKAAMPRWYAVYRSAMSRD